VAIDPDHVNKMVSWLSVKWRSGVLR